MERTPLVRNDPDPSTLLAAWSLLERLDGGENDDPSSQSPLEELATNIAMMETDRSIRGVIAEVEGFGSLVIRPGTSELVLGDSGIVKLPTEAVAGMLAVLTQQSTS